MTNMKFYEIMQSENTKHYEEHVVFFTTIDKVIDWLKSAKIKSAHKTCEYQWEISSTKWYYDDTMYKEPLTITYIANSSTSYRIVERTFED